MVTDNDHIEALRNRLLARQKDKEREVAEIQEMIRVLGAAPKMLAGSTATREPVDPRKAPATRNNNLAELVRQQITSTPYDEAINIGGMIKTLKADHGVTGKDTSLYAYIHTILKKEVGKKQALKYTKGVGFFRSRDGDKEKDSVLVAQV